ncbi:MAG: alpha/beta fold hydrolase [Patescibacteria group bacterium]|jgi:dipeptidyl aminopeptidase/acylaminoacyl peptidase
MKKITAIIVFAFIFVAGSVLAETTSTVKELSVSQIANQLKISSLKARAYPGSDFVVVSELDASSTYYRYIVSYESDGLKENGLLTVPKGEKPIGGWPAILFLHGYVQPEVYTTEKRYAAYVDYFAKKGYVVFKPDYRGHAESEGAPEGVYYSPAYAIDVLNALSSLKKYPDVNAKKIGYWAHSMGGNITLKNLLVDGKSIKAAVIWGGVVASYRDIMFNWPDNNPKAVYRPSPKDISVKQDYRKKIIAKYGTPKTNLSYWKLVDPTYYIKDITTPIQLHAGTKDLDVPIDFSRGFYNKMKLAKKKIELYTYKNGNHNLSAPNFDLAMKRSVAFFDKYLK